MEKGISTIIATVILVVITIGLISTAYVYFQSFARIGPIVSSMAPTPRCKWETDRYNVTISLKNEGTESWSSLDWYLDGSPLPSTITIVNTDCNSVAAGKTGNCLFSNTSATLDLSGTHVFTAIGPKNQVDIPVTC